MNVFDLFAKISLDDSEYTKGLSEAGSKLASFGKSAASGLATATKVTVAAAGAISGAMVAGAATTANAGDNIDKMSQKLGLSTEAYQKWDYVLGQSGTSIDSMQTGLKTLTNKLDDAKNGSEDAQAMFAQLGISVDELQNMSREDIFEAAITGFQGMADSTERAALANDLFGKSGQELAPLFNTSIEETQALMQAADDLGFVMSEEAVKASADFNDSMDTMKRTIGGVKNSLMGQFLPSMSKVMDGISKVVSGDKGGVKAITDGINDFLANMKDTIPLFMEAAGDILTAVIDGITENLPMLIDTALDLLVTLANGIIENLPALAESAVDILNEIVTTIAENLPMIIEAAVQLVVTLADGLAEKLPTLIPVILDGLMSMVDALIDHAPELLKAALSLIKSLAKGLIDYLPKLIERLPEIIEGIVQFLTSSPAELIGAALEIIIQLAGGLIKAIPELVKSIPKIITSIVNGLLDGLGKIADVGKNLVEGLWNGIGDKVEWIKDKIKGFGKDVIKGIKSIFGISSPSKVMAQMGEYLGEGLGIGWDDAMQDVKKDMTKDLDLQGDVTMRTNVESGSGFIGASATLGLAGIGGGGDIVIPIYIGESMLDEIIVNAEQVRNYRSGGR